MSMVNLLRPQMFLNIWLGVVLDSTLSFNDHIEHLRKALLKVLGVFSRARPRPLGKALKTMYLTMYL